MKSTNRQREWRQSPKTGRDVGTAARPAPEAVAEAITRHLRRRRDPARAAGVERYFKHAVVALGIDTPTLRSFAGEQVTRLRPVWTAAPALRCCDRLLRESELEIRGTGLLLLAGFPRELTGAFLPRAERWLRTRLDNWALVDSFCSAILSPLRDRDPAVQRTLKDWSHHPVIWVRRAALVTLVPFARRG
jgi:3-methyladenine DNA glycosylase AlkD